MIDEQHLRGMEPDELEDMKKDLHATIGILDKLIREKSPPPHQAGKMPALEDFTVIPPD